MWTENWITLKAVCTLKVTIPDRSKVTHCATSADGISYWIFVAWKEQCDKPVSTGLLHYSNGHNKLFVWGVFVKFDNDVSLNMTHKPKSKSVTPEVAYNLNPEPYLYPTYTQAVLQFLFLTSSRENENKEKTWSLCHFYLQLLQTQRRLQSRFVFLYSVYSAHPHY